jgi:hypothetical protein
MPEGDRSNQNTAFFLRFGESVHYKQATANSTAGSFNMYCPAQVAVSYNPKDISTFSTDFFQFFIRIFN